MVDSAADGQGGLYRSDNRGLTWTKVTGDKRIFNRGWYFGGITANPKNADQVWVANTIMLRSDDGGAHFIPTKGDPTGDDFHSLWIDPENPDRRILGVDQGTLITLNGGKTWSSWYNQPTGQFYHVSTDNRFPYRIYGAQQDLGAAAVPVRSDSVVDGITMAQFHEVTAGGESGEIAPDPNDPDIVYGGTVERLDLKSGQTKSVDPTLAFPDDYRGEWTLPLTFGKRDHALYFGNQRIFRTRDGGRTWTPISPDLTRTELTVPATLDAPTAADTATKGPRRGVVYDIATSPLTDGLIWAGTDDGLIWRTTDDGAHWQNVTPPALQPWSKVGIIEASHFDPNTAYAAIDRHRVDDQKPYILRTRDAGRNWQPVVQGLPNQGGPNSVNVVREDPVQRGLLFAGTERGAYVSFDDGDHWQPLANGLPTTSVRDITIHGNDVVIATHGRGFYVLDDIVPLRALAANAAPGLRLFPLATAVRLNEPGFTGTPMPKDEPLAPNPPLGAMIDYSIDGTAPQPVEIAIYDQSGAAVNRFTSSDPVKPDRPRNTPGRARVDCRCEAAARHARAPPLRLGPALRQGRWAQGFGYAGRRMGAAGTLYGRAYRRRPQVTAAVDDHRRSAGQGQPSRLRRRIPPRQADRGRSRARPVDARACGRPQKRLEQIARQCSTLAAIGGAGRRRCTHRRSQCTDDAYRRFGVARQIVTGGGRRRCRADAR